MKLFFDRKDIRHAEKLKDERFQWLRDLGATDIRKSRPDDSGFLFSYDHADAYLTKQVGNRPAIHDRPEERRELAHLDEVLRRLSAHDIDVPTPKTWLIEIDERLPDDLTFPAFVRTPKSSWKRGGGPAKVKNPKELSAESALLRRTFGWDTPIIVREWVDIAVAGQWMFGDAPQEVRTWVVDGEPVAWSFHYLHAVPNPVGFPPSGDDLTTLKSMAEAIARPFSSRLVAADFVRDVTGGWYFLEAGPGAVAGTAHEKVFKFVAGTLIGAATVPTLDTIGGAF